LERVLPHLLGLLPRPIQGMANEAKEGIGMAFVERFQGALVSAHDPPGQGQVLRRLPRQSRRLQFLHNGSHSLTWISRWKEQESFGRLSVYCAWQAGLRGPA